MRLYGRHVLHPAIFRAARTFGCAASLTSHAATKLPKKTDMVLKGGLDADVWRPQAATGSVPGEQLDAHSSLRGHGILEDIAEASSSTVAVAAIALNDPQVDKMGLVSVSSSFEELFGYSRQELWGKNATRLLCDGRVDPVLELYLEMASSASRLPQQTLPVTLRRKTGELVDSLVLVTKLKALPDVLLMLYADRMAQPDAEEQLLAQASV